jgi:hypothetical protein
VTKAGDIQAGCCLACPSFVVRKGNDCNDTTWFIFFIYNYILKYLSLIPNLLCGFFLKLENFSGIFGKSGTG